MKLFYYAVAWPSSAKEARKHDLNPSAPAKWVEQRKKDERKKNAFICSKDEEKSAQSD